MKKLVVLLAAVSAALCLASCAKGDAISGKWLASSVITADGREVSVLEMTADLGGLSADEPYVAYRFSGGVAQLYMNDEVLTGGYTISHDKVFLNVDGNESVLIYDAENDTLTTQGMGIRTVFRREGS